MTQALSVQAKKIELIQWLSMIDDEVVLDKIALLIEREQKNDWWNEISDAEKASLEKGIKDAEHGKLNSHQKARSIYGKWL